MRRRAMAKPKVATTSLCGCFGCHMSLLDIDDRILQLVELVDFDRSPINDIKEDHRAGRPSAWSRAAAANEENVKVLRGVPPRTAGADLGRRLRHQRWYPGDAQHGAARRVLRGGVPERPDGAQPGRPGHPDDEEIPLLLNQVYPCHEVVKPSTTTCPAVRRRPTRCGRR